MLPGTWWMFVKRRDSSVTDRASNNPGVRLDALCRPGGSNHLESLWPPSSHTFRPTTSAQADPVYREPR